MIREVLRIDCSEEEEKVAAACVILGVREEEIALEPATKRGVSLALCALQEIPPEWQRELALEALMIAPWRITS